jgi:hypothetical protein
LLEDRLVRATLDVTPAHLLTYHAEAGIASDLVINEVVQGTSHLYSFHDAAETITLTAEAKLHGWKGSGTHTVTGPASSFSKAVVVLSTMNDEVDLVSVSKPFTIDTGAGQDVVNIESVLHAGKVTVNTGTGADQINVGYLSHTLDHLNLSDFTLPDVIVNGNGQDFVNVYDDLEAQSTYYLYSDNGGGNGALQRSSPSAESHIVVHNIGSINIEAGGNPGNALEVLAAYEQHWLISGWNSGEVTGFAPGQLGTVHFAGIANLVSMSTDTVSMSTDALFSFFLGGEITGNIAADPGYDNGLDYSPLGFPVPVNLNADTAWGVAGNVFAFDFFIQG